MSRAQSAPASLPARPDNSDLGSDLGAVRADLGDRTHCEVCNSRANALFGDSSAKARLVFVGETPGEPESALLEKMIKAMGFARAEVILVNVAPCRPPENQSPEPNEATICSAFLDRQLEMIQPEVIVALGDFAAQTLLGAATPLAQLRGSFHTYRGIKLMPTFHPAYLLRNPAAKKEAWDDLKLVIKELGLPKPAARAP